jgi:N-acylneuraminate cytidylyltransferase
VKIYAFIFARGGSKGLPGKNIRPLGGVPLLAHSIQTAKRTVGIEKVFVSTDSDDIAKVAIEYEAEVIRRPAELATDSASEWLAWQHAVEHVRNKDGAFDVFVSLPTTCPLRNERDVAKCISALDEVTDFVITVTPANRNPYFNMVVREPTGESRVVMSGSGIHRRQDAPDVYDITTGAYVGRPDFIMTHSGLFSGRVCSVILPKERAVDIDDEYDFLVAERLYNIQKHES